MNQSEFLQLAKETDGAIEKKLFDSIEWDFSQLNRSDLPDIITFSECVFSGRLKIIGCKENLINQLIFDQCDLKKTSCILHSNEVNYVEFLDCQVGSLSIVYCKLRTVLIHNNSVKGTLRVNESKIDLVTIENLEQSKINQIRIYSPSIDVLNIKSNNTINSIELNSFNNASIIGAFQTVLVNGSNFNDLRIINNSNDTNFKRIEKLTIKNSSNSGILNLSNLNIETFEFKNFVNPGGAVRLNDLEIKKSTFQDLSIGKFYWDQINFITHLEILRCDLFGLKFSHINWLKGHKLSTSFLDRKTSIFSTKRLLNYLEINLRVKEMQYERDVYRQLKAASFANHNLPEALAFYRNEMHLYWKEIRINGGANWQDRVLVFLNRWVSDFGQSWGLPLMWLAIFHTLLYFCIIDFNFTLNWNAFKSGGGQFFELLNPVHKTPEYIKGFYIGIELLMRILDGFFIYHFIRATRKFAKI